MPQVHASGFPENIWLWRGIIFWLVTDSCPIFLSTRGKPNAIHVQSKTPIKLNRSKKPSHRTIPRKEWSGKTSTNTFNSGNSEEKINKRFTGKSWKQFEFKTCYTCEKASQLFYKSRVLHSIMVVRACGVYSRGGGLPQFSLFCLFLYICRQKYVIGDGYYTCVPIRILFQKS